MQNVETEAACMMEHRGVNAAESLWVLEASYFASTRCDVCNSM